MITYWVIRNGSFGISNYRQNRGMAIADRFDARCYEDVETRLRVAAGPQIFSAIDLLTPGQRDVAVAIWDAHAAAAPVGRRLNNPRRVLGRYELLQKLHKEGINAFRVFRTSQIRELTRFPVFIRHRYAHNGTLTQLLTSRSEVVRALARLRLRGLPLRDLLIVEYCDTSGADGSFRKYGAFRVGDSILACHLMVSREWSVKSSSSELEVSTIRESADFVTSNPHEAWLRRVFDIAGIEYGRADYGILDGVPQLWEVNVNPTLGGAPGSSKHASLAPALRSLREEGRQAFHRQLQAAFVALEDGHPCNDVVATIDPGRLRRAQSEAAAAERRQRRVNSMREFYNRVAPSRSGT